MRKFLQMLPVLVAGFAGGMAGAVLMQPSPLLAAQSSEQAPPKSMLPLDLYNISGKRVAYMGPGQIHQGTFFLYDAKQNVRIQMGSYTGRREEGQALIGLHDRHNRLRLLLRIAGHEDAPVMVFKDQYGRDRLEIGLFGGAEEPYVKVTDKNGLSRYVIDPGK